MGILNFTNVTKGFGEGPARRDAQSIARRVESRQLHSGLQAVGQISPALLP